MNQETLNQLVLAQEHENKQTFKEMFDVWAKHYKHLLDICSKMLQQHILSQKLSLEIHEKLNMDLDMQWMEDRLLMFKIQTNQTIFDSSLATTQRVPRWPGVC